MTSYTVLVTKEDGAFIVDVPALPGCHTYGHSLEEAVENAREAIELYLEELRARGEPMPADVQTLTVQVAA
jgi:predicted RNase H-like HicB family nuclease